MPISAKKLARKQLFAKIGRVITKLGDPNTPDYLTGKPSSFKLKNGPSQDPALRGDSRGPKMKTPQWERTIR